MRTSSVYHHDVSAGLFFKSHFFKIKRGGEKFKKIVVEGKIFYLVKCRNCNKIYYLSEKEKLKFLMSYSGGAGPRFVCKDGKPEVDFSYLCFEFIV